MSFSCEKKEEMREEMDWEKEELKWVETQEIGHTQIIVM